MKTNKINLTVYFFATLMTIYSCSVYKPTTAPIDEIVKSESKVRIKTNTNRHLSFKKVIIKDQHYYGIVGMGENTREVLFFPADIKTMKIYDEQKSGQMVVGTILGLAALAGIMVYAVSNMQIYGD